MKNHDPDKFSQYIYKLKKITEEQEKVIQKQQETIEQLMTAFLEHNKDIENLNAVGGTYFLWLVGLTIGACLLWANMPSSQPVIVPYPPTELNQ
ncbi:hypothetical protein [Picosynechococcus sp. PCC 73109]|uniref:hypothetical protein n=1 Tax=Picosynechococcus sp. PCC 73109 TaxID=374982 RepID=UPI0007458B90|nr:hypothetical protein [Picosynechococcus sp. PCC 73109]AMA07905.1 hypothetical protein AWQ23_00430 [Picosynechococcus sp. PCC 73109]